MAPRRGGGGGGYSSYYSSSENQCSYAGAFSDSLSIGTLAIIATFAALQILVLAMYVVIRLRKKTTKNIVRFYTYGLALVFALAGKIITIIALVLNQCDILQSYTYLSIVILAEWLSVAALVPLLYVIAVPAVSVLHALAGTSTSLRRIVKIAHLVGFAIVSILLLAYLAYYTSVAAKPNTFGFATGLSYLKIYAAAIFLYALLVLSACANMLLAVAKMRGAGVQSGGLKVLVPLLLVGGVGYALIEFAVVIINLNALDGSYGYTTDATFLARAAIDRGFEFIAYVAILLIASSKAVALYDANSPAGHAVHGSAYNKDSQAPEYAGVPNQTQPQQQMYGHPGQYPPQNVPPQ